MALPPKTSFSKGFALCDREGKPAGHSFRQTADAAIATVGRRSWGRMQRQGWSVQPVYARVFIPQFFTNRPDIEDETE